MPVVIALVISIFFVTLFLVAFRSPTPHHLRVGLAAPAAVTGQIRRIAAERSPGALDLRSYPDPAAAQDAVQRRDVYAAVVVDNGGWTLLVAGANGSALAAALQRQFTPVASAAGARLAVRDVVPRAPGDKTGLAIFYAAFGLVLGGFLFGINTIQIAPRLGFWARMGSVALFGPLCGVAAAAAGHTLDALEGSFVVSAGILTLIAAAVGVATIMLLRLFGPFGITLGSMLLLTLGNASSAAVFPPALLPGWLEPFAYALPPGAGVRALSGAAYFQGGGVVSGVAVLSAWIVISALIIFMLDRRAPRHG
ncbi:MAG: SNG1 family protein [Actinomycetota bacterium]|nr:SNG1 family protein [Actinomycetota bacterium]